MFTIKKQYVAILITVLLTWCGITSSQAQNKRELRAVWIATIGNIDWPSKQRLPSTTQKNEFIQHLNRMQRIGINTIIIQVRPAADAFYNSKYEPWSRYLSGKQGVASKPFYDPLQFIIDECHKRNIDVHAWFNPYRALVNNRSNPNPSDHVTKQHPEWLIPFKSLSYFDPGNPDAREYIINVILDAVSKYDFEAVHIDDYFYPYPSKGHRFNDDFTFKKYNPKGKSLADWRRDNVNTFIKQINKEIKAIKPYMKFGVSPFGIWRNQRDDPEGSATRGSSCYDELYSDIRLWVRKGWVDYVAPQLYWKRGHRAADFNALLPWWSDNRANRNLHIGLGVYRMVKAKRGSTWSSPNEILAQISAGREHKVGGFALYSLSSFRKISKQLENALAKPEYFGNISFPPTATWIDATAPYPPQLQILKSKNKISLQWQVKNPTKEPLKFAIYKFPKGEKINLNDNSKIISLTKQLHFTEQVTPNKYTYIVTALDRLWNESNPSNPVEN